MGLWPGIDDADGEIGADHPADITTGTFGIVGDINRVISLAIDLLRLLENLLGTELDAEAALLTSICNNPDFFVFSFLIGFRQGYPPLTGVMITFIPSRLQI